MVVGVDRGLELDLRGAPQRQLVEAVAELVEQHARGHLAVLVDDQGKVKSAILLNKLGHGLDELALDRARKIEFEPAKDTDDKPVSSVVVWTFNMTLPK